MNWPSTRSLDIVRSVALTSKFRQRVGAGILKGNRVCTSKANALKTHPKLAEFSRFPFLHAESHAIISHGLERCNGLDLLVVRVMRGTSGLGCAKPCPVCLALCQNVGIRNIYYSDWDGEIKVLSPVAQR